ncbi:transmembrane protein, putative [Medicago truncatula]|uniref:Transmembrane protein, putative n=1 Tax=Medicago truncatula TaxID=3880 RepID=G7J9P6_MEDTR|nr:transmembrane protein, putative [Medicago truncatula]
MPERIGDSLFGEVGYFKLDILWKWLRALVVCCAFEAEAVVFGACETVLVLLLLLYMTASVFCFDSKTNTYTDITVQKSAATIVRLRIAITVQKIAATIVRLRIAIHVGFASVKFVFLHYSSSA